MAPPDWPQFAVDESTEGKILNKSKLLLIGWDAADWKVIRPLLDSGQMPNLARFVEEGVMADNLTLQPPLSPMLWNSIATGMLPDRHGILGFTEVDPATATVRPVTSTSRRVKAIWNILMQNGYRTHVVNWFGGHPAEPVDGVCVSDAFTRGEPDVDEPWRMIPGTVYPENLAEELAGLRMRATEIDGETLQLFAPRAGEVDQQEDKRLHILARLLAECVSNHAAATHIMDRDPWDFMAVYYPSLDHFSHAFMNYHPPRQSWVSEQEFAIYNDVVNSAYRFHDMMLGVLCEKAGPEATVVLVSDHGFHPGALRPQVLLNVPAGPADQHRSHGIFAMKGPNVRKDERIYGVGLLDIAPTLLAICGLPAGQDMPGRVLNEAFERPADLERIESWENVAGNCGMHTVNHAIAAQDAQALIDQFVALGYIDQPNQDQREAVRQCQMEQNWNLARVYNSTHRPEKALPLLETAHEEAPERVDVTLALAHCQLRLGLTAEARVTARSALSTFRDTPAANWVLANVEFEAGHAEEALRQLEIARSAAPSTPGFYLRLAGVYVKLRRWEEAREACLHTIELDPECAEAYQLLAHCCLRLGSPQAAACFALQAVGYEHQLPFAHLFLGIALFRLGETERAVAAFETALKLQSLPAAHAWLYRIWSRANQRQKAWEHFQAAMEIRRQRVLALERGEQIRAHARERASGRTQRPTPRAATSDRPLFRPFASLNCEDGSGDEFIVVSGLPRSGTSLAMQLLRAAGVPVMTDHRRQADEDNPEGYWEWEDVKKLPSDPNVLLQAKGTAVKIVSMLIPHLPGPHRYKVIFMDRPIGEVVASHRKMLARAGRQPSREDASMAENLSRHRGAVLDQLHKRRDCQVLVVNYPSLVHEPQLWIRRILDFIGKPNVDAQILTGIIRPDLYRNLIPA